MNIVDRTWTRVQTFDVPRLVPGRVPPAYRSAYRCPEGNEGHKEGNSGSTRIFTTDATKLRCQRAMYRAHLSSLILRGSSSRLHAASFLAGWNDNGKTCLLVSRFCIGFSNVECCDPCDSRSGFHAQCVNLMGRSGRPVSLRWRVPGASECLCFRVVSKGLIVCQ